VGRPYFSRLERGQPLQREREIARGLKAIRGRLLEATLDDPHQRGRNWTRRRVEHAAWRFAQDGTHRVERRVSAEGSLSGEHLEEHGAEGEEVRAVIHRLSPYLFG